jgi:hypothetical protein
MDIKSFDLLDLPDELLYLIFIKLNTMDAGVARGIEKFSFRLGKTENFP